MELRNGVSFGGPFVAIAVALGRAAGPPALLRAGPPFAAVGLASSIIFGGYGMSPRDLVAVIGTSTATRASLWIAWILITLPAARALITTPEAFVLRSLPAPLWWFWIVHALHLVALQAPWMLLFAAGGSPLASMASGVAAAAATALVVAGPRSLVEIAASSALASAIGLGAAHVWLLVIAIFAAIVGVSSAFARAPERAAGAGHAWMPRSAPLALSLAHAAVLVRRDAVTLVRGACVALIGAVIAALAMRNNTATTREDQEMITLAAGAIPLSIAVTGVAGRVLVTERRLGWLLGSSGASARLRAIVAAGITAAWGAAMGAIYGAAIALTMTEGASRRARISTLAITLGAALAACAAHLARHAERPTGVDGTAIVAGMAALAIASTAISASIGAAAVAPIAAVAIALFVSTEHVLMRRERLVEHATRTVWEDG